MDGLTRTGLTKQDKLLPWLFLGPALALIAALLYYPMVGTVIESLYQSSFINPAPRFVGLDGYATVLQSEEFGEVVRNSIVWTIGVVVFQNLIGFATALLLDQRLPGRGLTRALVLLPWILPGVVTAILWRFMYDPQLGLINSVFIWTGVINESEAWLADSSTAMIAVIVAAVWKGFPFSTLIYLAALQNLDREQLESATIDGAGPVRRLVDIILPSLREVILVNIVLTMVLTYNYFDMVWVLTRGGPLNATHIFPTKIYELGFGQFQFGQAAIYGVFSIMLLAVLVSLYFLAQRTQRARRRTA